LLRCAKGNISLWQCRGGYFERALGEKKGSRAVCWPKLKVLRSDRRDGSSETAVKYLIRGQMSVEPKARFSSILLKANRKENKPTCNFSLSSASEYIACLRCAEVMFSWPAQGSSVLLQRGLVWLSHDAPPSLQSLQFIQNRHNFFLFPSARLFVGGMAASQGFSVSCGGACQVLPGSIDARDQRGRLLVFNYYFVELPCVLCWGRDAAAGLLSPKMSDPLSAGDLKGVGGVFSTSPSSISSFHRGVCFLLLSSGMGTFMVFNDFFSPNDPSQESPRGRRDLGLLLGGEGRAAVAVMEQL